jgi:two-component system, sensor histidine kinase
MTTMSQPPLRILVVDDSPDDADSLALLLTVLGHEVRTAYDGPTALRVAGTTRPQVVFLDITQPRMDGCEVARRLRAQGGSADAPLLAATGSGPEADRRCGQTPGFDHFLAKPFDLNVLGRLLADRQALATRPNACQPKGRPGPTA